MEESKLTLERCIARASFPILEMAHFLNGDSSTTIQKEKIMAELDADPLFDDFIQKRMEMSKKELRKLTFRRALKLQEALDRITIDGASGAGEEEKEEARELVTTTYALADFDTCIRHFVHSHLFGGAIKGQGTREQVAKWGPLVERLGVWGCFGMTEIGHGSFVPGLETTATFDPATDEFELRSPGVAATKWWIGAAAESATHCAVFARLRTRGRDYGVHTFIVQLRDLNSFDVLPGIKIGDCGMKMGANGIDNGWIQFHGARIPRENLLSRYAQLSREGVYTPPPSPQVAYGALLGGRALLVTLSVGAMQKALTIAINYSLVRKQGMAGSNRSGEGEGEGGESPLLAFGAQRRRLLVPLARCVALGAGPLRPLRRLLARLRAGLAAGDLALLPEAHALAAGLKAVATADAHAALDQCRQACGGHGYSALNGLAQLQRDFAVMGTWEGDNSVMAQQTARFLVKSLRAARRTGQGGERGPGGGPPPPPPLAPSVAYLARRRDPPAVDDAATLGTALADPNYSLSLVAAVSQFKVAQVVEALDAAGKEKEDETWNNLQVELISCARTYVWHNVLKEFKESIQKAPVSLQGVLGRLWVVAALGALEEDAAALAAAALLSPAAALSLGRELGQACAALAPDAAPVVAAFGLGRAALQTCLGGGGDGHRPSYARYLAQAQATEEQLGPAYARELTEALRRNREEGNGSRGLINSRL